MWATARHTRQLGPSCTALRALPISLDRLDRMNLIINRIISIISPSSKNILANKMFKISVGRKEMFYLTTHSTHFIYGYMIKDQSDRKTEPTRCRLMGYSFRLTARVLLYSSSHRQDNTYHGLCYTNRGALAGTRNSSMGPPSTIDPTTHRTMSERFYHGATSRSISIEYNNFKIDGAHFTILIVLGALDQISILYKFRFKKIVQRLKCWRRRIELPQRT